MKKALFLPVKQMMVFTVILAGLFLFKPIQAQITITSVSVGAQNGTVTYGTAGSVTFPVTFTSSGSGSGTTSLSINWIAPTGASTSAPIVLNFTETPTGTLTISTTTATPAGATSFTITSSNGAVTSAAASFTVTGKMITISGLTGNTKVYDGTRVATVTAAGGTPSLTGVLPADVGNVAAGGAPVFSFATATVGTGKAITVETGYTLVGPAAGNYLPVQPTGLSADVTQRPTTITGITGKNREYDGTTIATVSGTPALSDVVGIDATNITIEGTPAFSFADDAIGNAKPITVTGYVLNGSSAVNYLLSQPTTLTANIGTKALSITGLTGANKVYDRTATASVTGAPVLNGMVTGDAVTLGGTPLITFTDYLVGNAKPITVSGYTLSGADAGNYTLTQPTGLTGNITPKPLPISGLTPVASKVYTGTTGITVSGTPSITGVIDPDVVVLNSDAPGYAYATKTVGTNKVIVAPGLALTGANKDNYIIAPLTITADITPATLTITGPAVNNKIYDGTLTATITGTLTGVLLTDEVVLVGTGSFANKNVNNGIAVTTACTLTGADAGNYTLTQPAAMTANILVRPLTIAATGPAKIYGTALISGPSLVNYSATGLADGEAITSVTLQPNTAGLLSLTNAGAAYTVTPKLPVTSTGAFLISNYEVTWTIFNSSVAPKPINIIPNPGQIKVLNTEDPLLLYTCNPALLGSDTFTGTLARAAGTTIGSYAITMGTLSAGPNYALTLSPENFQITSGTGAQITAFNFKLPVTYAETIDQVGGTISIPVANSVNLATLIPMFTASPGAVVRVTGITQTSGVSVQNFTGSVVNYAVTSGDGQTTKLYNVAVTRNAALTDKQLLSFSLNGVPDATGTINETNHTVVVPIPATLNVANLVAAFSVSPYARVKIGATYLTSGVTAFDFTAALTTGITCIVEAENTSTQSYTVTFTRSAARTDKVLISYSLPGIEGAIDELDHSIRMTVPFAYILTGRIATFTSSYGSTLLLSTTLQTSGVTVNDFTAATTSGITFTVKAEDNLSTQTYTLYITKTAASTENSMLTFSFNGLAAPAIGVIDHGTGTISVTVPYSATLTNLVATFTSSPYSAVTVAGVAQISGTTPRNFTTDQTYTVTSESGTPKNYVVHVAQTPASLAKQLLSFQVATTNGPVIGSVNQTNKTVSVELPFGSDVTNLVATFTMSPFATVKIGNVIQSSGITSNNFQTTLEYKVWAENGVDFEIYYVTVYVAPGFYYFRFNDVATVPTGTIDHVAKTIVVHVPASTDITTLKAYFGISAGASAFIGTVAQTSAVTENNFTTAKTYRLVMQDGRNVSYLITVVKDVARTGKDITGFAFNGLTPACTGIINQTTHTIAVNLPFGTDVTALVSSFTISELATIKVGTVAQTSGVTANNFTTPVIYTLTAEDGSTQNYTVTANVAPGSSAKDITYFAFEDFSPDFVCNINQATHTITDTLPNGIDRTNLRAYFITSPLSSVRVLGDAGGFQQSGLTINNFRVPVYYEVTAQDGTKQVYTVIISEGQDITKPIVSNQAQTVSNLPGQFVMLRSNEPTGKVYIILESVTQTTVAQLEAAVASGYGRYTYVSAANTDIPISTASLPAGRYYAYALDNAGNLSDRGVNAITVIDRIPPTVTVAAQTITNGLNQVVNVKSSDASSIVYLVLEGVPQSTKTQLDAAVLAKNAGRALVVSANVDVPISVAGLTPGNYRAYAVDVPNLNLSAPSTTQVVITLASRLKALLAFSFNELTPPAIGQISGEVINVKVRVGTPVTALKATFTISPLSSAYVGSVLQVSGVTANDFTTPVTYRVVAEDGSDALYYVTVEFNTGIEETEWFNSIKAYPNPVSDHLTIQMPTPADRIQIMNSLGQTIEDIRKPGQTTIEVQTSSWMDGLYFVRYFRNNEFIGVQKLIKD